MIPNLMMMMKTQQMNKQLIIYTLIGCGFCESLKSKLLYNNIQFQEICCSNDSNTCDKMENLLNCDLYPIAQVKLSISKNVIFCLTNQHSQINTNIIEGSNVIFYVHSIDNMIHAIKNM